MKYTTISSDNVALALLNLKQLTFEVTDDTLLADVRAPKLRSMNSPLLLAVVVAEEVIAVGFVSVPHICQDHSIVPCPGVALSYAAIFSSS